MASFNLFVSPIEPAKEGFNHRIMTAQRGIQTLVLCSIKKKKMEAANRIVKVDKSNFKTIDSFFYEIKKFLIADDVEINKEATDDEIKEFERANNVVLSNELNKYFKIINGIDGALFLAKLNPISELKRVIDYDWYSNTEFTKNEIQNFEKTFILGDIMIDSHQWGIILNENGETEKIIELDFKKIIANNISDFLASFVNETPYSLVG